MSKSIQKKEVSDILPQYRRKNGVIQCASCGELLHAGEEFYQRNGNPYCSICLDNADTEDLIRICEISKRNWLEQMGFFQGIAKGSEDAWH